MIMISAILSTVTKMPEQFYVSPRAVMTIVPSLDVGRVVMKSSQFVAYKRGNGLKNKKPLDQGLPGAIKGNCLFYCGH